MRVNGRSEPLDRLRRRTLLLLTVGQILGGLGLGAALSVGALAVNELAGAAWSGLAATVTTLGAGLLAVPLARLADRSGRRVSLSTAALIAAGGALVCVLALEARSAVLLFLGLGLAGAGTAAALQSRFAATDLASAGQPGPRSLPGGVVDHDRSRHRTQSGGARKRPGRGPRVVAVRRNLRVPAGHPAVSRPLCYLVWMRPDPLLESRRRSLDAAATRRW